MPPRSLLVFASSAFVPLATMPVWLRAVAEHQPVTVTIDAVRALMAGEPAGAALGRSVGWSAALATAFVPLAVRGYQRAHT